MIDGGIRGGGIGIALPFAGVGMGEGGMAVNGAVFKDNIAIAMAAPPAPAIAEVSAASGLGSSGSSASSISSSNV